MPAPAFWSEGLNWIVFISTGQSLGSKVPYGLSKRTGQKLHKGRVRPKRAGCIILEECKHDVEDGGHAWLGGAPIPAVGKTSQDRAATEEMWQFFQTCRLEDQPPALSRLLGSH